MSEMEKETPAESMEEGRDTLFSPPETSMEEGRDTLMEEGRDTLFSPPKTCSRRPTVISNDTHEKHKMSTRSSIRSPTSTDTMGSDASFPQIPVRTSFKTFNTAGSSCGHGVGLQSR